MNAETPAAAGDPGMTTDDVSQLPGLAVHALNTAMYAACAAMTCSRALVVGVVGVVDDEGAVVVVAGADVEGVGRGPFVLPQPARASTVTTTTHLETYRRRGRPSPHTAVLRTLAA